MTGNGNDLKPDKKTPKIVRKKSGRSARRNVATLEDITLQQKRTRSGRPGLLKYTLLFLYKNLYILGITLLRRRRRYSKRFFGMMERFRARAQRGLDRVGRGIAGTWKSLINRIKAPFVRIKDVRVQMQPVIAQSRRDGKIPLRAYGRIAFTFLRLLYAILRTLINYGAPIVAAFLLYNHIIGELNRPLALEVTYNGEVLGYIQYEAEFEEATRILQDRFISDEDVAVVGTPEFRLVEPDEEYTTPKELANKIVSMSGDEIEWGYGLYIDNDFYGAVTDSEPVLYDMENLLESNSTGAPDEEVRFVRSIKLEPGLYPATSMVEEEDLLDVINGNETVDEYYTVEDGDSPSLVSEKLGLSVQELETLNPGLEDRMVPGEQIRTQVAQPFLSVMNVYTTEYLEEIPYSTEDILTDLYAIGYEMVEREGEDGSQRVWAQVSAVNGVVVNQTVLDTEIVRAPVAQRVVKGTNNPRDTSTAAPRPTPQTPGGPPIVSSAGFAWPTEGGVVTVGLGGYYGHTGVDIPRPYGTNVYASRAGTVVLAKYTGVGYGRYIMIDHGDGFVTLYAHNSELYVSVGDYVSQGQTIAAVGRTGNATGNHVHFEVRYQGQILDPVQYIGR